MIESLRRAVDRRIGGTLDRKVAVVEREQQAPAADPARFKLPKGWGWRRDAYAALPPPFPAPST